MGGVDIRTVQELMGYKMLAMTLRYAHLSPAHRLEDTSTESTGRTSRRRRTAK
jgi:site-specific recombinase XerD